MAQGNNSGESESISTTPGKALLMWCLLTSIIHTIITVKFDNMENFVSFGIAISYYAGQFFAVLIIGSVVGFPFGLTGKASGNFWKRFCYGLIVSNFIFIYIKSSNYYGWLR